MLVTIDRSHSGADERAKHLQREFEAAFVASGAPKGAALFRRRRRAGAYVFYLSPEAVGIFPGLEAYSPERCSEPSTKDASLLVGHRDARGLLKT